VSVVSVKMRRRCPPPSFSCTASPGRGAPGIRWLQRLDRERYTALAPDLRGHGGRERPRADQLRRLRGGRAGRGARALRPLWLLDGRPDRAARRARGARAHRAPGARRDDGGHRGRGGPPGAHADDERLAAFADTRDDRAVRRPLGGQPLFAGTPPRRRASGARTCCATTPARWPRSCAASAPASWSRCGSGCGTLAVPARVLAGGGGREVRGAGRRLAPRCPAGACRRRRGGPRPAARGAGGGFCRHAAG
jgi:hypothetical protein